MQTGALRDRLMKIPKVRGMLIKRGQERQNEDALELAKGSVGPRKV